MKITHKMTIIDKLREILRVKKLKQKDLAGKLGVSEKTMSFWLNDKKRPSGESEVKINEMYAELYSAPTSEAQNMIQKAQSKGEIDETEKSFSEREKVYYEGKFYVKEMEKENRRYVYIYPSMGKVKDEWYKVGGRSLLFYKNLLAPRLEREARVRDDTDKVYRFKGGIVSIKRGNRLMMEAKELGYPVERTEYGIIVIDLGKEYTDAEIGKMKEVVKNERGKTKKMIKPKENYPSIIIAMNDLVKVLPSKIKKLDKDYKRILGDGLLEPMTEMLKIYFRMANGGMEKRDAKLEMLERTDDLMAMIYLMDEAQMLNATVRTTMGENVVKIRNAIEETL